MRIPALETERLIVRELSASDGDAVSRGRTRACGAGRRLHRVSEGMELGLRGQALTGRLEPAQRIYDLRASVVVHLELDEAIRDQAALGALPVLADAVRPNVARGGEHLQEIGAGLGLETDEDVCVLHRREL